MAADGVSGAGDGVAVVRDRPMSQRQEDQVRRWIRAAELRARHMSYEQIAAELGYAGHEGARNAVRRGLALLPSEDTREAHRLESLALDRIGRDAAALWDDPGPLVSQGKIIFDAAGNPFPDNQVRISALQVLLKLSAERRAFRGLNAPKRSVNVLTEIPVTDLQAHVEQLRRELGLPEDWAPGAGPGGAIAGFALPLGEDGQAGGDQDGL